MFLAVQGDDDLIVYPLAAVPRLDTAVFPLEVVDLVHRLLACQPRDRPTVADALGVVANADPLSVSGAALALSEGALRGFGALN